MGGWSEGGPEPCTRRQISWIGSFPQVCSPPYKIINETQMGMGTGIVLELYCVTQ